MTPEFGAKYTATKERYVVIIQIEASQALPYVDLVGIPCFTRPIRSTVAVSSGVSK